MVCMLATATGAMIWSWGEKWREMGGGELQGAGWLQGMAPEMQTR